VSEAKAEAVIIYWTGGRFGFSQRNGDEPYIAILAAEAREFFERAKFVAGLVPACTVEDETAQEDFMARCDKYLATLPKNREPDAA